MHQIRISASSRLVTSAHICMSPTRRCTSIMYSSSLALYICSSNLSSIAPEPEMAPSPSPMSPELPASPPSPSPGGEGAFNSMPSNRSSSSASDMVADRRTGSCNILRHLRLYGPSFFHATPATCSTRYSSAMSVEGCPRACTPSRHFRSATTRCVRGPLLVELAPVSADAPNPAAPPCGCPSTAPPASAMAAASGISALRYPDEGNRRLLSHMSQYVTVALFCCCVRRESSSISRSKPSRATSTTTSSSIRGEPTMASARMTAR
mmetsp:Transcript_4706/g.8136  ORF Transcript_4706/g.8136 Transcript_4706/m.8136 type:complete len:265 (+) Transcript_4706:356-1150(+)